MELGKQLGCEYCRIEEGAKERANRRCWEPHCQVEQATGLYHFITCHREIDIDGSCYESSEMKQCGWERMSMPDAYILCLIAEPLLLLGRVLWLTGFFAVPVFRCYQDAKEHGLRRLLSRLLQPSSHPFWHSRTYMVQLFDQIALVNAGQIMSITRYSPQKALAHKLPVVTAVTPTCRTGSGRGTVRLLGANLTAFGCTVVVKSRGGHLCVAPGRPVAAAGAVGEEGSGVLGGGGNVKGQEGVEVEVFLPSGPQLVWVECANGSYHSVARPVLLVEDELVAEVSRGRWGERERAGSR